MQQNYSSKETTDSVNLSQSINSEQNDIPKTPIMTISLQNNKNANKNSKQKKQKITSKIISLNNLSNEHPVPKSQIQLNNIAKNNQNNEENFLTGKWSDEEHELFLEGILKYGNEWKKVQQIIKTRDSAQARSHAQKFIMKIKKKFKLDENITNIKEKNKIIDKIINSILPKKRVETLTKNQKEKLLSAISCNIKLEEESDNEDELHLGFDDIDSFRYKSDISENNATIKNNIINFDFNNYFPIDEINRPCKFSLGKKRKLTKTFDNKEYKKERSQKHSIDLTFNKINEKDNNIDDMSEINNLGFIDNYNNIKNGYNNENLIKRFMNYNCSNNNQNINDDKSNYIINNVINVTNNIISNKFVYNFYNNENINNNNFCQEPNLYEKNDCINNDNNQIIFDKSFLNEFQCKNYLNENCLNNYKINYNDNNEVNPFQLNFNNITSINDLDNERQLEILGDDLFS